MITIHRSAVPPRARLQAHQLTRGQLYAAFDGNGQYAGIVLATARDPLLLSCDGAAQQRAAELDFVTNKVFRFEIANGVKICVENTDA